ncbi:MAG: protein kinase [Desulfobacteraceae bacterium]|jgi:serine/threonine protein kinase/Tfp pilus assembly protein PilF
MAQFKPTKLGKYTLLDRIAVGGMAELYRAMIRGDQGFEKLIAIKRLLPHLADEDNVVTSFIDEAKLAALLQHRNIVQIYDFGSMEGNYFIAMEYLFGKDLQAMIKKANELEYNLKLETALFMATQICEALDYAHNRKDLQGNPLHIIHRDVSPQNIFITYGGEVKIIDFGIAKASSQSSETQQGAIKGKIAYMSPEQAEGKRVDHRSDIFASAILLYEMLTGTRMFNGDAMEVLSQVREARFQPLEAIVPHLPPEIYSIMHRALSLHPDQRYQTSGEMLADLNLCIHKRGLHQNSQGLALFMKDLYVDDIVTEELTIQSVTKMDVHDPIAKAKAAIRAAEKTAKMPPEELPRIRRIPWKRVALARIPWKRIPFAGTPWKRIALAGIPGIGIAVLLIIFLVWNPPGKNGPPASPLASASGPGHLSEGPLSQGPPESAMVEAGLRALEQGHYDEAAGLFEKVLSKDENRLSDLSEPYARALQGQALALRNRDPRKAKKLLLQSLTINPQDIRSRFHLGLLYLRLKEYAKAVDAYQKVIQQNPSFTEAYFNLGYIYAMRREYAEAEAMYSCVVELAPMYLDEAYYNLAMIQEKRGKLGECLVNLEQAVTVNPDNSPAKRSLKRIRKKVAKK